jgi:uncharacterized protein (DUF302 family)
MTTGLVTVSSVHGFAQTLERLTQAIGQGGAEVFARIDHAANAQAAGLALRPTTVLVFGAGKAGTPLMQAEQSLGLDLPLRALVYEDARGRIWVAYNCPDWIAERQGLDPGAFPPVAGMTRFLEAAVAHATGG